MTAESIPEAQVCLTCPRCGDQEVGVDAVVLTLSGQPWIASVSVICPCCVMPLVVHPDPGTVGRLLAAGVEPNRFEALNQDDEVERFADELAAADYLSAIAKRGGRHPR